MKDKTINNLIIVFIVCTTLYVLFPLCVLIIGLCYGSRNLIPFYIVLALNSVILVPWIIYLGRLLILYRKALKSAPRLKGTVCGRTFTVVGEHYFEGLKIEYDGQTYVTPKVYREYIVESLSRERETVIFIIVKNKAYITEVVTMVKA